MNARLQVEHPVTEAVYRRSTSSSCSCASPRASRCGCARTDVRPRGHAVEARVYAEDPAHGFLPSTGRIVAYARAGAGVRVDSGRRARAARSAPTTTRCSPRSSPTRRTAPTALARLDARARRAAPCSAPPTNAAFTCGRCWRDPRCAPASIDTGLIERLGGRARAAAARRPRCRPPRSRLLGDAAGDDPWDARDGWRRGVRPAPRLTVAVRDGERPTRPRRDAGRAATARRRRTARCAVDARRRSSRPLRRRPRRRRASGSADDGGTALEAPRRAARAAPAPAPRRGSLEAPMPGTVLARARRRAATRSRRATCCVVLESMKMELAIAAPARRRRRRRRRRAPATRSRRGQALVGGGGAR